jgi:hypothetical protein
MRTTTRLQQNSKALLQVLYAQLRSRRITSVRKYTQLSQSSHIKCTYAAL